MQGQNKTHRFSCYPSYKGSIDLVIDLIGRCFSSASGVPLVLSIVTLLVLASTYGMPSTLSMSQPSVP